MPPVSNTGILAPLRSNLLTSSTLPLPFLDSFHLLSQPRLYLYLFSTLFTSFLVSTCARERVRSLPPNFYSSSTSSRLFSPSLSTWIDGSFGVTKGREPLKPIAAQIEKPNRAVPKAGFKRVAKGRRPKGRGAVRVRVRLNQADFWKPGALCSF